MILLISFKALITACLYTLFFLKQRSEKTLDSLNLGCALLKINSINFVKFKFPKTNLAMLEFELKFHVMVCIMQGWPPSLILLIQNKQ